MRLADVETALDIFGLSLAPASLESLPLSCWEPEPEFERPDREPEGPALPDISFYLDAFVSV